jgi:hypothetical protein
VSESQRNESVPPPAPHPTDAPRAGFTCVSREPGHTVHYAAALKQAPSLVPVPATLHVHETDDDLGLEVDGETSPVWSHNPAALWALVEELGSRCAWYPTLQLACWPTADTRHWVHLSLEPVGPCMSAEGARRAEWRHWMT